MSKKVAYSTESPESTVVKARPINGGSISIIQKSSLSKNIRDEVNKRSRN